MDEFTIKDVEYLVDCHCDNCGDLEPLTATYENGERYCIDCGRMGDLEITDEEYAQIYVIESTKKIVHFKKRIAELEEELKISNVEGELNGEEN